MGEEKGAPKDPKEGAKAPGGPPGGESPDGDWTELLRSLGRTLVTAAISAGSLLGFVAFIGSVALWTRFSAVQVAPDQVVAVAPKTEALAIGSVMLLLFGLFGALAAIAIYLIDRKGRATPGMSRGLLLIIAIEAVVVVWATAEASVESRAIATEVLALLFGAALWTTFVGGLIQLDPDKLPGQVEGEKAQDEEDRAFHRRGGAPGIAPIPTIAVVLLSCVASAAVFAAVAVFWSLSWGWMIGLATLMALLLLAVGIHWLRFELRHNPRHRDARDRRQKRAKVAPETGSRWKRLRAWWKAASKLPPAPTEEVKEAEGRPPGFVLTVWGALVQVPLAVAAVAIPALILGAWWVAIVLAATMVIGSGLWRVAGFAKKRFLWLGLAVFVSVPLFGTLLLMARNIEDPQVQPLALIRSTDGPDEAIQGLYVTETEDRVYFANVATEGCDSRIARDSGRLLWVPRDEVVAMSIGPLQDVDDAALAALEMSYALTPEVETPIGDHVSLITPAEERAVGGSGGSNLATPEGRLEDPGPGVRPSFGSGLKLIPETASPRQVVELRLSAPNESVHGFGPRPEGRTVRIDGVQVTLLREGARHASEAEYVKTEDSDEAESVEPTLLSLDKAGVYRQVDGEPELLGDEQFDGRRYVKLEDSEVETIRTDVADGREASEADLDGEFDEYLEVNNDETKLLGKPKVKLAGEEEFVPLDGDFRRQTWNEDAIRFRVPDNVSTGVVTVECGQLAGQPLLRVSHAPSARIAVRMRPNSVGVVLDSSLSSDEDEAVEGDEISRRWEIEGVGRGNRERIRAALPPRTGAYSVKLTVTDKAGNFDTAELELLRMPASLFEFNDAVPANGPALKGARETLEELAQTQHPVAIEIDGHADDPGTGRYNVRLSLHRAVHVRGRLLHQADDDAAFTIPVRTLAYGEGCPADPRPGRNRRNRRVDVFVLEQGVTVVPPAICNPRRFQSTRWRVSP